jgi:O-antigen/teichoic acid export membrane protein
MSFRPDDGQTDPERLEEASSDAHPLLATKVKMDHRLLRNGISAIVGRIAIVALSAVILPVLSRVTTPDEFGLYLLCVSVTLLLSYAGALGINLSLVRTIATQLSMNRFADAASTVRRGVGTSMAGAVGIAAAWYAFLHFADFEFCRAFRDYRIALASSCWLAAQSMGLVLGDAFRGSHNMRAAIAFGGLAPMVIFATSIATAGAMGNVALERVLWCAVAAWTLSACAGLFVLHLRLRQWESLAAGQDPGSTVAVSTLLSASLPLMISTVASLVGAQIDLWVVGWHCAADEHPLALYAAAARLVAIVNTALIIVNTVIPPMIAELHAHARTAALERLLRGTATLAGVPAGIMLVVMLLAGDQLLELIYGPFYRDGGSVLRILATGNLVFVFGGSAGAALLMTGYSKTAMAISVGFSLMILATTIAAAPYGIEAVATAVALCVAGQKILLVLCVRRYLAIWPQLYFFPSWNRLRSSFVLEAT